MISRESKLIIFVAVLASLLEIIDASIVNVAIPTMMGNLGATLEDISMIITGYAIANAIILPVSAWLGARIGRQRYYLGCITAFTLTSVACGFAPNLTTLIIFRIFQGLAGGALLPTSQALIYEQFPKEKAGLAGAIFGMSVMIGPALGPVLGGYLTDNFGWRSIFNINVPLGILALVVGSLVIKDSEDHGHAHSDQKNHGPNVATGTSGPSKKADIDILGLALIAIGIGCLQFVLERGEVEDWFDSNLILMCSLIAGFCLPTFVWWEMRVPNPIINIRLFKDATVRNGTFLMANVGFFLYGIVFILPVFIGRTLNYDATQIGMLFIPGSILTALMMPFVGKQVGKMDPRILISVGFIALELCLLCMYHFSPQTSKQDILNALYLRGFGMAFLFVPINAAILSQFRGLALGQVSGLLNLSRQIGGSLGIALGATLLTMRSHQNYADMQSKVTSLHPMAQSLYVQTQQSFQYKLPKQVGFGLPASQAQKVFYYKAQNQVFMMSFLQLVATIGFLFLLGFIPLIRLKLKSKTNASAALEAH